MTKKKPHPAPKLVHGHTDDGFYYLPQPVPEVTLVMVLDELCHMLLRA